MSDSENIDPEDELLMHTYATLPTNCKKYWNKRYNIFSKFDDGVFLTSELWYSVTPESTAKSTARIVRKLLPDCENVLDVCCGGGGNTIQFARYFKSVGGVDINANNIKCTKHNCGIYGVEDNTWFYQGDWNVMSQSTDWIPEFIPNEKFDFIFCSPPWGGPKYKTRGAFDLYAMKPLELRSLCTSMMKFTDNYGLFLPRYLDLDQIREVTEELYGSESKTRVVCLWQNGAPLGILAIFGPTFNVDIGAYRE
ncbi:CIC11C00000001975 [Sungouiella intermedia]|uniref:Trimethylguanosine synthase n=1 Tax=Sungouiella intermedia TaxID=45354 RepID=A0A1L0BD10_9ASCO|nr:CIC11C00000001975 [[Candida] intermedia]